MNFQQAMIAHGLMPRRIEADGKWHRCATADKPNKQNGAYLLWLGGQRGFYKNFATDDDYLEWRSDKPISVHDQRAIDNRIRRMRNAEAAARARAVSAMRLHWESLPILTNWHAYIERKGLTLQGCAGLRLDGDDLVIPMYLGGALVSLQNIAMDGEKLYRAGCPTTGASFVMNRRGSTVTCLVEGFATGLAVYQSIPTSKVIVCFSNHNMERIAKDMKMRGLTVVCADNDSKTEAKIGRNPGLDSGKKAAATIGCGVAYPEGIEGTDWADALKEWGDRGPAKVRMQIMKQAKLVV